MPQESDSYTIPVILADEKARSDVKKLESDLNTFEKRSKIDLSIKANIAALQQSLDQARKNLREFKKAGDKESEIKTRINILDLQKGLKDARKALRDNEKEATKTVGAYKKLSDRLNAVRNEYKNLAAAGQANTARAKQLRDEVGRLDTRLKGIDASVGQFQRNVGGYFGAIKRNFLSIAGVVAGGFGLRELFGGITRSFLEGEKAFIKVAKTIDGLDDGFGNLTELGLSLRKEMREIAKNTGIAFEELSRFAELGGQLGIGAQNIAKFSETVGRLSLSISGLSAEEAATSLAKISGIAGLADDKIENLGSTLVALGNNFKANENDILNFGNRLITSANLAGFTAEQTLALGAALTEAGINAEAGGTAISSLLDQITEAVNDGGRQLDLFARSSGVSAELFAKKWKEEPQEAFSLFITGIGELGDKSGGVLSELGINSERASRAIRALGGISERTGEAFDLASKAYSDNTALLLESQRALSTTSAKLSRYREIAKSAAFTVGETLKNSIVFLGENMDKLLGVMAAVASLLAGKLIASLVGVAAKAIAAAKGVGILTAATGALSSALKRIPFVAAAGLIGVWISKLAGAKEEQNKFEQEMQILNQTINETKRSFSALADVIGEEYAKSLEDSFVSTTEAQKRVEELKRELGEMRDEMKFLGDFSDLTVEQMKEVSSAYGSLSAPIEAYIAKSEELRNLTGQVAEGGKALEQSLKDIATQYGVSDEELNKVIERYNEIQQSNVSLTEKTIQSQKAIDEFTRNGVENYEEVSRSAIQAFDDIIRSQEEVNYDAAIAEVRNFANVNDTVWQGIIEDAIVEARRSGNIGQSFGIGLAAGMTESQVIQTIQNSGQIVTDEMLANVDPAVRGAFSVGNNISAALANGINTGIPLIDNSVNRVLGRLNPIVGKIKTVFGEIQAFQPEPVETIGGLEKEVGDLNSALKEAAIGSEEFSRIQGELTTKQEQLNSAMGRTTKSTGGASRATSSLKNEAAELAEAEREAAEQLRKKTDKLEEYRDDVEDTTEATKSYSEKAVEYFDDIAESIEDAKARQKELRAELEEFTTGKTQSFVEDAAKRELSLKEDLAKAEEDLAKARAEATDTAEIEQRIALIQQERDQIAAFISEQGQGQAFQGEIEFLGKTEFEQSRIEFEEELARKREEIKAEIKKQEEIVQVQEAFQANKIKTEEDFNAFLEENNLETIGIEQRRIFEEQILQRQALEQEKAEIIAQQEEILNKKTTFYKLAEQVALETNESIKQSTQEMIEYLNSAISRQRELNSLSGAASDAASSSTTNNNVTVNQNISSVNDAYASTKEIFSKVQ